MIKATELRIGNLVLLQNPEYRLIESNKIYIVLEIREKSAFVTIPGSYNEYGQYYEFLKPVLLTEEILLKVGFEVKPFSIGLLLDRFRFMWKDEYKYWYVVDRYSGSYFTKIEYVHELQNFIFVMNGQELNVSQLL